MADIKQTPRFVFAIRTNDMDDKTGLDVEEKIAAAYFEVNNDGDLLLFDVEERGHHVIMAYARGEWKRVSKAV